MKIAKLIQDLEKIQKKYGNVDVMSSIDNNDDGIYPVNSASFRVAKKNEFPEDWNMPKGFKFVEIRN